MRPSLLPLLLAVLAAPAAAQDRAAQYESALDAFTLPTATGFGLGDLLEEEAVEALLPSLEGDWVSALVMFPGRGQWDEETLAGACARTPMTLSAIAARSFEMRRTGQQDGQPVSLAIRYDFLIGNSFDRSLPEAEALSFFGLDQRPDPSAGSLAFEAMRGEVAMFHPSPDMLVFVAPGTPPEILARCP